MRVYGVIYGLTLSLLCSFTIMVLLRQYTNAKALLTLGLLIFYVRDVLKTYNKRYFGEDVFTYHIHVLHPLGFFMILKNFMWLEEINKENLNSNSDALE